MCDLIFHNANAITMDPVHSRAELIAIQDGKILLTGGNELLSSLTSRKTRAVDCAGRTVLPGFIDAHCHLHAYAESLVSLNLSPKEGVRSISVIQEKIRRLCEKLPPGNWIRGKSYNEFYLAERRHPDRRDLDAAALLHPVKLTHRSGHAHVLNSLALKIAGIGEETGDPPGGMIDRDSTGLPTGILYGLGSYLAERIPPLDEAETERGAVLANEKLLSCGITSVQDASPVNGPAQWRRFVKWKVNGILQPRITMMTGLDSSAVPDPLDWSSQLGADELRLGGTKIIANEVTGSLHPTQKELDEAVCAIHAAGRQAAIHAIEEPVIEAALRAIESALKRNFRKDHRHRIEHCSLCRPELLRRLARAGVTVVTQPAFIYFSGDRYLQTVPPDQLEYLYPVRSMLDAGLLVGAGSDCPIADPNPLLSMWAAITRMTEEGAALPQQRIGLLDAIKLHTINAAASAFEDGIKGSLTPGKAADVVMLSENIFEADQGRIKDVQVVLTVLGGEVVRSSSSISNL